jgi:hypothetical protein
MFLKRDDAVIFALSISVTESLYFVTYFAVLLQNSLVLFSLGCECEFVIIVPASYGSMRQCSMSNAPMAGEPSARRGYVGRNE